MPNDTSSIPIDTNEPQTVKYTEMYDYDQDGFATVLYPIYDVYGRLSRKEQRRMHRREIEKFNREHFNV